MFKVEDKPVYAKKAQKEKCKKEEIVKKNLKRKSDSLHEESTPKKQIARGNKYKEILCILAQEETLCLSLSLLLSLFLFCIHYFDF